MPQQQQLGGRRWASMAVSPPSKSPPSSKSKERSQKQKQQQLQKQKQQQLLQKRKQQQRRNMSDEYLLSNEDDDLYAARMKYLKERRPRQSRGIHRPPPPVFNFANSGNRKGYKTILSYDRTASAPTKDLQSLVLAMTRELLRNEVLHLSDILNEQNPFEMRNMRLNSFIANTPDLMDHWKVAMLDEGVKIIDDSFMADDLDWVKPGSGAGSSFFMPIDEQTLMLLPADKPEISKSQVATEYIQAQRGHQAHEQEDALQLFQSEMLKAENAASASQEMFDRICSCYKPILQKAVEIEFIEKRPETCQAVEEYVETLKNSVDHVLQESLTAHLENAREHGDKFLRILVGKTMDELHSLHEARNFDPIRVLISTHRQD